MKNLNDNKIRNQINPANEHFYRIIKLSSCNYKFNNNMPTTVKMVVVVVVCVCVLLCAQSKNLLIFGIVRFHKLFGYSRNSKSIENNAKNRSKNIKWFNFYGYLKSQLMYGNNSNKCPCSIKRPHLGPITPPPQ